MTTRRGRLELLALVVAALVLIAVELGLGAIGFGATRTADPCTSRPALRGGGVDGAVQRFGLSALNGAACELHTSREELVLSFTPSPNDRIRWDSATITRALRAGLDRAARESAGDGPAGAFLAFVLRQIVDHPVQWFLGES
jgi:hypothetical protein